MRSKIGWILGTAALVIMLAGCGKGNPPPIPAPAPIPQTNPNGTPYGGGVGAVSCGGVAGQYPFSQTPFYGNLTSNYSYSTGNSIQLTLGYQGYANGTSNTQTVLGSAMLNLPDLSAQSYNPMYGNQPMPTSFCVTSMSLTGGQPFPGYYAPADHSIAITMYGYVQTPIQMYNPYDQSPYYGGGVQYQQSPVTVSIGQGCAAYLYDGRIMGCVLVKIGNNGQTRYYQAQ